MTAQKSRLMRALALVDETGKLEHILPPLRRLVSADEARELASRLRYSRYRPPKRRGPKPRGPATAHNIRAVAAANEVRALARERGVQQRDVVNEVAARHNMHPNSVDRALAQKDAAHRHLMRDTPRI